MRAEQVLPKIGGNRASRFLKTFALVALSTVFSLLAIEIGLRVWQPDSLRLFPRFHEAVRYGPYVLRRTRPDTRFVHSGVDGQWTFEINHQGFRDDHDYHTEREAGVQRVLVLGDSQAMGYENQREDAFPEQLERKLGHRGRPVEVINSGVAGFGTAEEAAFLEESGLRLKPDAVVLLFYRNDYSDNVRSDLFRLDGDRLVASRSTYAPGTAILGVINDFAVVRWLSQHSYVYSLAFNAVWNGVKNRQIRSTVDANEHVVSLVTSVPDRQRLLAEALIQRIATNLSARGIAFLVVDVPEMPLDRDIRSFRPSLEPASVRNLQASGVNVLASEPIFATYRGGEVFRRPHGELHVSPFVHHMMAHVAGAALAPALRGVPRP